MPKQHDVAAGKLNIIKGLVSSFDTAAKNPCNNVETTFNAEKFISLAAFNMLQV